MYFYPFFCVCKQSVEKVTIFNKQNLNNDDVLFTGQLLAAWFTCANRYHFNLKLRSFFFFFGI